jgi:hypothetical protein
MESRLFSISPINMLYQRLWLDKAEMNKEIKAHPQAGCPVIIGGRVAQAFQDMPFGQIWRSSGQPIGAQAMIVAAYGHDRNASEMMSS